MYYKLIISYDGTAYSGWQIQKGQVSITQILCTTFRTVFAHDITLIGASRTDAGVHALGQVALAITPLSINAKILQSAWNNALPKEIHIRTISSIDGLFHPRRNVAHKLYWYHFFVRRPLPFVHRYGWFYRYPLDMQKLHEVLQLFVGTHDFRSFVKGYEQEDTVRTIDAISLCYLPRFKAYRIEVKGKRFLHHMVRRIVGAAMTCASHQDVSIAEVQKILYAKNPQHTLPNAPAQGLLLYKIVYKKM